ncbi:hypothetical protein K445DRAFT_17379 [Daldinia sp. EC12]|nr:hypothetical protein K445DRAFT_17379 [Daldinia sp. EC12]
MVKENYKEEAIEVKAQITSEMTRAIETETRETSNPNTKRRCAESTALEDIKTEIKVEMKSIKDEIKKMINDRPAPNLSTPSKTRTWADIAATPTTQYNNNNVAVPARRMREITVTGSSTSPDTMKRTPEETVKAINQAIGKQDSPCSSGLLI